MSKHLVDLAGSHRTAPEGLKAIGRVPEGEPITISIYLKNRDTPPPETGTQGAPLLRSTLRDQREDSHADDMAAVTDFAKAHNLAVVLADPARRLVQLKGTAADLEAALHTELNHYEGDGGQVVRGRTGALQLPADLAEHVDAVLGLDTRPTATPKLVKHPHKAAPQGFLPTEVATLYGFGGLSAAGQCIAIIELGGGFTPADNDAAFKAMGLPVPTITAVGVDGGTNNPADGSGANGEVALDIQVAGGFAPGATIAVYFAPNTDQGFVDAITQAVHDTANKPSVISISWGSSESNWTGQALTAMNAAFQDAAKVGVTVLAASGDSLATDGEKDGKAHVDYPASDPYVLGCGGTRLTGSGSKVSAEVVWKSNGGGTGGGVSAQFTPPAYQKGVKLPKAPSATGGRGVPDIAGDADPDSGFHIWTDGKEGLIGGTSAVAPLWAGIVAAMNAARGAPLGYCHATLYANAKAFRDITSGDNKSGKVGFAAAKGWDPCTGLGAPTAAIRTLLAAKPAAH